MLLGVFYLLYYKEVHTRNLIHCILSELYNWSECVELLVKYVTLVYPFLNLYIFYWRENSHQLL